MNLLLKVKVGRDGGSNVVNLEWFNCQWECGEVGRRKGSEVAWWERWEDSEVGRQKRREGSAVAKWERREGNEVTRWKRWEGSEVARWESGEMRRWEVPGYIQGWGMQGESKISSFCLGC